MAKERFHDFDAAWAEAAPLTIKVQGELHRLPASLPLKIVTRIAREHQEKGGNYELPLEELQELAAGIFGRGKLEAWIDNGLGLHQLQDLFEKTIALYQQDDEGQPEGEAQAPTTGAPSNESSSTGGSSKPISLASTG
jgi:hypothetical protein